MTKTWNETLAYRQELLDGKREAVIEDVAWLLTELKIAEDKYIYYRDKDK